MGVFDGVHQGHQYLLGQAVQEGQDRGTQSWAVTFNIDPDELFREPGSVHKLLGNQRRLALLAQSGVDGVLVVPFGKETAALAPAAFLDTVLGAALSPCGIHVGHDFRFGAKAGGTVDDLRLWADANNAHVQGHELLSDHGTPVTATRIRSLLAQGEVAAANSLLTRPHLLEALVEEGRHVGKELGFPTANLRPAPMSATVGDGVYAAYALFDDGSGLQRYKAAVSVGVPATFGDLPTTTEAFLLDYPSDAPALYGRPMAIEFIEYLRPMQRFATPAALQAEITANVAWIRENL